MEDMAQKTRYRSQSARLTPAEVIAIFDSFKQGHQGKALAAQYGVTKGMVSSIVHKRKWKWLLAER
jgi:hypothetical protein